MKISKSDKHNPNYLAKIVVIEQLRKHENADSLMIATVDFQDVIVSDKTQIGKPYIYFPIESAINKEFLSMTNSFRDTTLNRDPEAKGFFEKTGRVRAVKLRGLPSMGYLVPLSDMEAFVGASLYEHVGEEFDTIGDTLIVKKYVIRLREPKEPRQGQKPRISRLVEGQVKLHVDTEQLRKNMFLINPFDKISISDKTHGTSFWVSNVIVKKKLNFFYKLLKKLGVKVQDTENDYVYGSRKVVKNEYETADKAHFYDYDLWADIKDKFVGKLPAGFTVYGEALGYTKNGAMIQEGYDYGCVGDEMKIEVYRVTVTNNEGVTIDLSSEQIKGFCERIGFDTVTYHYIGEACELYPDTSPSEHWHENFLKKLELDYTEKDCHKCKNNVPAEGVVLRKESLFGFEAYKLKSFRFLEWETKMLDSGKSDLESEN